MGPVETYHVASGLMKVAEAPSIIRSISGVGFSIAVLHDSAPVGGLLHLPSLMTNPDPGAMETRLRRFYEELWGSAGGKGSCRAVVAGGADILHVIPSHLLERFVNTYVETISDMLGRYYTALSGRFTGGASARILEVDIGRRTFNVSECPGAPIDSRRLNAPKRQGATGDTVTRNVVVDMGKMHVDRAPSNLVAILGSCVGIALYDPQTKIGGLAHAMMPACLDDRSNPAKYADSAVRALLDEMARQGACRSGLQAKLFGGASMLQMSHGNRKSRIPYLNVFASRRALEEERIELKEHDTGGTRGRKIIICLVDFSVVVRRVS